MSPGKRVPPISEEARALCELLTIEQVAELLQVKVSWIYDQVQDGSMPSVKIGGHRRFRPAEIDAWISGTWRAS